MISYGFLCFSISDHKQGIREYKKRAREAERERERMKERGNMRPSG